MDALPTQAFVENVNKSKCNASDMPCLRPIPLTTVVHAHTYIYMHTHTHTLHRALCTRTHNLSDMHTYNFHKRMQCSCTCAIINARTHIHTHILTKLVKHTHTSTAHRALCCASFVTQSHLLSACVPCWWLGWVSVAHLTHPAGSVRTHNTQCHRLWSSG